MTDKIKPYTTADLIDIAVNNKRIDPLRVLATYANPDNWGSVHDEQGHHWCWNGPVIVGYELAQNVLKQEQKIDPFALREPDKCPKCGTYLSIRNKKKGIGVEAFCPKDHAE